MKTTYQKIVEWAQKQAYWLQFALDRALSSAEITDSVRDEIFAFFLEESGLQSTSLTRHTLSFNEKLDFSVVPSAKLLSIKDVRNVNRLIAGQTLPIGDHLTTVFGANGSGKTGYARLIGSFAFTRGNREILPDCTKSEDEQKEPMTAEIQLSTATRRYQVGEQVPEMGAYHVFDSASVGAHLTKANAISFTPTGLTCLKKLVDIINDVQARLQRLIEAKTQPNLFSAHFRNPSPIQGIISTLSAQTDLEALKTLGSVGETDQERLRTIDVEIGGLTADQNHERRRQLERDSQSIAALKFFLERLCHSLSPEQIDRLQQSIAELVEAESALAMNSLEQFKIDGIQSTGTEAWIELVRAAKRAADHEGAVRGHSYPETGDPCLLCHQSLSIDAQELLKRIWQYVDGQLQGAVNTAADRLSVLTKSVQSLLGDFRLHESALSALKVINEPLAVSVSEVLSLGQQMLVLQTVAVAARGTVQHATLVIPMDEISQLHQRLLADVEILGQIDRVAEIEKLRVEQTNLQHRVLLKDYLSDILAFVESCRWIEKAKAAMPNTRTVSEKYNKLFSELVSDNYVERFQHYASQFLHESVKVSIKTKGSQGEAVRQVILEIAPKQRLDRVLSEGEQRAVAFADFLTEASLDPSCRGIVVDDPVTSFGLEWRKSAAVALVEEAKARQVVIFTHDLAFLFWLMEAATKAGVDARSHWMQRDGHGLPGFISPDNSPTLEKEYRTSEKAKKHLQRARDAKDAEEGQSFIDQGFTALRTSYEALIMLELLHGSITRFNERISVDAFKRIRWNPQTVAEIIERFEGMCYRMEGHLHSDELAMGNPTITLLEEEIGHFDRLRKQVKDDSKLEPGAFVVAQPAAAAETKLTVVRNDAHSNKAQ